MTAGFEITADDLLAGAGATYRITIPPELLPAAGKSEMVIQLRPLTIGVFQLIMRAARQDPGLIPLLMIKESLVQPTLTIEQVKLLHLGLVSFLISKIREISGLEEKKSPSSR